MQHLALTGGIGSGKSTTTKLLASRGAKIVDSDEITSQLQEPGELVYDKIVQAWGAEVVGADGRLDRSVLASKIFADSEQRQELEAIVHPEVYGEIERQVEAVAATYNVVIVDIPLLAETGNRGRATGVIVVDCEVEIAVSRLMKYRGLQEAEAQSRISSQATREQRLALADYVVDNSGDLASLKTEVDKCWSWIQSQAD